MVEECGQLLVLGTLGSQRGGVHGVCGRGSVPGFRGVARLVVGAVFRWGLAGCLQAHLGFVQVLYCSERLAGRRSPRPASAALVVLMPSVGSASVPTCSSLFSLKRSHPACRRNILLR